MKIAIVASLFAKGNMDINACQFVCDFMDIFIADSNSTCPWPVKADNL
jgi:hypothetical protein